MTSNKSLARIVQRTRNRSGVPSSHYTNRADITIPDEYQRYEGSPGNFERFLLGDSGSDDPNRILIFGRENTRTWVGEVKKIYVDGTFSLTPRAFSQVFIILGERPDIVVPMCYVLMPNKN